MIILFYSAVVMANRFIAALLWINPALVRELETESQRFANVILTMSAERDKPFANLAGALHIAIRMRGAKATLATAEDWRFVYLGKGRRLIEGWKFKRWCELIGRKTDCIEGRSSEDADVF
jgi:hypothetical protein